MSDAKFSAARREFTDKLISFVADVENDKNGFNANYYRKYLGSMSDNKFKEFVTRLANEENFNIFFEADITDTKHTPDLNRIDQLGKKYNVPLTEYITLPYKDNSNPDNPPITQTPVPVVYVLIRPLQQMIDKKNAMSSRIDSSNALTGQVSSSSKVSTFTNMQTMSIVCSMPDNPKVAKELLGPRADDMKAKEFMINQIETTGDYDIDDFKTQPEDKRSNNTVYTMLTGAGLDVAISDRKTFKETMKVRDKLLNK